MHRPNYIIAMDAGTTSVRCIVFDRRGGIRGQAQQTFAQHYPHPGWVEHDPSEIWTAQREVTTLAIERAGAQPEDVAAIGITNQRETTVVWDAATGKPICPAIVWQCRRTADRIERLRRDGMEDRVREKTGLIPDAYFSATKLAWILDSVPGARARAERGELRFGTIDSWLIWNLTEGEVHATDYSNASRTMLFDIHHLCWDEELLDYFRIPRSLLPMVKPSSSLFGRTALFGGSIPIAGTAGDQQAALFGQCGFRPGDVKSTYGTGGFLLMNTGERVIRSRQGLLATIAASPGGTVQYALEGSVFIAGAAIQWLRDELGLVSSSPASEAACRAVEDTDGVYVVPAFSGLGAPYWEPYARGTIVGLTRGTGRDHLIRATVESLAYQTNDLLRAMGKEAGMEVAALRVDGGACANDFLMQFQSDISNLVLQRPACIETTALGTAYLAGLAVGFWQDQEEILSIWSCERTFHPTCSPEERIRRCRGWERAVRCALSWAAEEDKGKGTL